MADIKDMLTMAGCLEQFASTEKVVRMVNRAASHDGEKWVTCAWLAMHLRAMGLKCSRHDVSMLIYDMDVRRREGNDGRVSLSSLHAMAGDGAIMQYITDLEYQTRLLAPSVPLTIDVGPEVGMEVLQGELLPLESPEGVKTHKNMALAT